MCTLTFTFYSMKAKASQHEVVRKMNAREELLNQLLQNAKSNLEKYTTGSQYQKLIEDLIVQGLVKLMEEKVKIKSYKW